MKETILFIIALLPIALEVFLVDPLYWKKGKSDKPMSTIIRVLMTVALMIIFGAETALVVLGSYMFFDFIVGWKNQRDPWYLGDGKWDRFIKNIPRHVALYFRMALAAFFWTGFFHIDQGDTVFNPVIDWLNGWM